MQVTAHTRGEAAEAQTSGTSQKQPGAAVREPAGFEQGSDRALAFLFKMCVRVCARVRVHAHVCVMRSVAWYVLMPCSASGVTSVKRGQPGHFMILLVGYVAGADECIKCAGMSPSAALKWSEELSPQECVCKASYLFSVCVHPTKSLLLLCLLENCITR